MQLCLAISIVFISAIPLCAQAIPPDSLYLGQTPPGNTPKIFSLPVTSGLHAVERIAITSDGKEIYYAELNTYPPTNMRIKSFKYQNNKWQGPFISFEGYFAPRLSLNDSIMYIQKGIDTYYSKRTDTAWSPPAKLLSTTKQTHYFLTTKLNNIYAASNFTANVENRDICRLITVNSDTIIQSLGLPVSTLYDESDFFLDENESYLLVCRSINSAAGDILISFKNDKEKWTNPKSLGEQINTPSPNWEYGQFVTKDNKYLFFTRGGNNMNSYFVYWVKIDNIIDSLKHTNFVPYLNYQIPNQSTQTGNLFTYTVPDSTFIDDDGNNTLTYSATLSNGSQLPAWLSFNPNTRTFIGTPTEAININLKVTAADSANAIISCTFTINITITAIEGTQKQLPESVILYQNYPNPFNPSTIIEFAIPKTGRYSLGLYNTLGELVKEISNREYKTGSYKETFNAAGLSSGMYIYRLVGNEVNIVRKMVLIR